MAKWAIGLLKRKKLLILKNNHMTLSAALPELAKIAKQNSLKLHFAKDFKKAVQIYKSKIKN